MTTVDIGRFEVVSDLDAVARAAAAAILEVARSRPPVGVFLAGGSTVRRTCEVVAATAAPGDLAATHLWLVDDRPVPLDHAESNAGMIATLWQPLGVAHDAAGASDGPRLHTLVAAGGVAAQIAALERDLRGLGGDEPRPDLIVFGVGGDGHVGGLVPGGSGLDATGLYTAVSGGHRVTATRGLLGAGRRLLFLLSGAAKADIAARIAADPRSTPAGIVAAEAQARGASVTWLLDRDAAARLRAVE